MTDVRETGGAPRATCYHVVTAVWGSEYIKLFLDVCVPNQLSVDNLNALPQGSRYRIFTGRADYAALAASPELDDVRRILPVEIVEVDLTELDPQANPNTYKMMTACHRRAIADAARDQAALIFLAPDFVLAEGTIGRLVALHSTGVRAVLTANLRLSRESFTAAWHREGILRAVAPRQLVQLALQHLHPSTDSYMVDGSSTNEFPSAVYWPVRSSHGIDGLLIRAFHLHPMLVDPAHRMMLPTGTIDGHYVMDCCPDPHECMVVTDSDELAIFELTPSARLVGADNRRRGISLLRLAAVAAKCDEYQRSHWQRPIRLHGGEIDARWPAVETASEMLVGELDRYRHVGPALARIYRTRKMWRRRGAGYARTLRHAVRRDARTALRAVRRPLRKRESYARTLRKALRPPFTTKQLVRSVKLFYHRAAKAGKRGLKRMRRRSRLFRAA